MLSISFFVIIYAGFIHAFETDHLLAVSNIVSQRNNTRLSLKDGIFWGLGHASTIFIVGMLMIVFKAAIPANTFHYVEVVVGIMLITLAVVRLVKFFSGKKLVIHTHAGASHNHLHVHVVNKPKLKHNHSLAYGVGLVHGLAGSGALLLVVMAQMKGAADGLVYLLVFSMGCMGGMLLAAGLCSIPFSKKMMQARSLQTFLIITSCALCLLYGGRVIYQNLIA